LRTDSPGDTLARVRIAQSRILRLSIGVLASLLVLSASALAANQTVTLNSSNTFTPAGVTVFQGETVTWNNTGGFHNVHFDDNSYIQPSPPQSAPWTRARTFNTPGTFRYYCEVHGGPGGTGMSGTVTVTAATGYARPKGATPLRASLAPAYKPCTSANRTHGAPLSFPSCNPPVQVSNFLTVGTPDASANGKAANSIGSVTLKTLAGPGDVGIVSSLTDIRRKSDLADYTGELQAKLPLRITDKYNGASLTDAATGDTTFAVTIPCAGTSDTLVGSTCVITTTANAVTPGAVVDAARAIWELSNVQVFDGGADGAASTADNTLFADQAVFVP
jgi:plastocyanin